MRVHACVCVCVFLLQVLERGGPYPQVILPEFGGYWIEDPEAPAPPPNSLEIKVAEEVEVGGGLAGGEEEDTAPGDYGYRLEEISEAARAYRKHFLGRVRFGRGGYCSTNGSFSPFAMVTCWLL